ncbi:MAG: hypothetical protein FJX71_06010 [Alphaproteobacteria bacterium]|nr:hypothetical protein [Alphaproteobacteria bacterium]
MTSAVDIDEGTVACVADIVASAAHKAAPVVDIAESIVVDIVVGIVANIVRLRLYEPIWMPVPRKLAQFEKFVSS